MNHRMIVLFLITLVGLVPERSIAQSQRQEIVTPSGNIIIPPSSVENTGDRGQRAHTNHLIFEPEKGPLRRSGMPVGETPGSLACVYGTTTTASFPDCPITGNISSGNNGLPSASGGSGIIAIVDAYDYPTAENDFNVFSAQFGLECTTANGCFQKIFASGTKPAANCGWAQEAALDIEWAHAMAPNAKIVLVEAASNSFTDLIAAVDVASSIVTANHGKGQVSMSWGGSEFFSETGYDSHFTANNVVYFAASGDSGGKTIWPGISPNVVSAGGTTINRDNSGNYVSETAWSGSGGGASQYEPRPSYQDPIWDMVGTQRGAPDLSFDANPNTGVWVYDSTSCHRQNGWLIFGGTSVSSPALAGIVNVAGSFASSSTSELGTIYSICSNGASSCVSSTSPSDFRDITSGTAGSFTANTGWDFVTGVGSSLGLAGK